MTSFCHDLSEGVFIILQEGAFLASLGMQCQTGSCVYNSSHPAPPGPPAPPSPPPLPPHEHHDVAAEVITLIGIGGVVSLGMMVGAFLIYQDNRLSQERYKAWSEGVCDMGQIFKHAAYKNTDIQTPTRGSLQVHL